MKYYNAVNFLIQDFTVYTTACGCESCDVDGFKWIELHILPNELLMLVYIIVQVNALSSMCIQFHGCNQLKSSKTATMTHLLL